MLNDKKSGAKTTTKKAFDEKPEAPTKRSYMTRKKSYEILGVDNTTSEEDIKRAYHDLAKKYHPDHNKSEDADEAFKKINKAYELLVRPTGKKEAVVVCTHCGHPMEISTALQAAEETKPAEPQPAPSKRILILPIIIAVQVICLLVLAYLYVDSLNTRTEIQLNDLQQQNELMKLSLNGYQKKVDMLSAMMTFINDTDAGSSSGSFFASDKIIVLSKSEKTSFEITAKFKQPYTVEWEYNSSFILVTEDTEWNDKVLTLYLTPVAVGYDYIVFTNDKNLQKFRVMVIVTD